MLTKIYPDTKNIEGIYNDMHANYSEDTNEHTPTLKDVVVDPEHRFCTFICVMMAIFNQLVGVNTINLYSTSIFQKMIDEGSTMFVTPEVAGIFVGASGFVGAFLANFNVYFMTRRQVFVGGHFLMMVFIFLTVIFLNDNNGNSCLLCITALNIVFQGTNGGCFWVYTGEIG